MPKYSILTAPKEATYCAITNPPDDMANTARPAKGKSMKGSYPGRLDFEMSRTLNPNGIQIPDAILNTLSYLMASDSLKAILEKNANPTIEFLPFRLINHKGRVGAERCWIVNVVGTVDCGEAAQSKGIDSPFAPGTLITCDALAIDERRVPDDATVFRATLYPPCIFVRNDVRAEIEATGMVVRFVNSGEPLL